MTEENLPALLEKDGIVCEAFDRPEAKAMLVSGVLEHFPDKPLVAASGMAGLGSANTIRTRRAFGRLYLCGDGTSDVSGVLGLVSARVAVCAAHAAVGNEGLKKLASVLKWVVTSLLTACLLYTSRCV